MPNQTTIETQLKEASQLTNTTWAALVEREAGKWRILSHFHLAKKAQPALVKFLSKSEVDSWLCGALSGGQSRSVSLSNLSTLDAARLFAFPLTGASRVILAGAAQLTNDSQRLWRLLVSGMQTDSAPVDASALSSVAASLLIPDLNSENPYDLPRALDRALTSFVRLISVQGGWLAILRGDSLEVRAQWNAPSCADLVLTIDAHVLFRRMSNNLTPMVVHRGDELWSEIPHKGLKSNTRLWTCVPLVIGQRLIGALVLWRTSEFKGDEWNRMIDFATQVAPAIETIITFDEMSGHLLRLGMLNDFAITISSGRNLDQIARRMFALLARAFGTELIALYLLSSDNRLLNEYRITDGNTLTTSRETSASVTSTVRSAEEHRIFPLLMNGQKVRLGENQVDVNLPLYDRALSGLYVPLRFRGQTIGILCVESLRNNAFNLYDESLMTVIASHLASLADYTRLREEAEGRARNLGLIHEVVQQVIGLTDQREVAVITSDLLARYFAYELAAVFIADEKGNLTIGGFGGTSQNVVKRAMKSFEYPVMGGITGYVFGTGESIMVNDVLQDKRYRSIKGWQAGSEMCVAIRESEKIIGIIDVESSSRNAFTHNDFIALESLAGILASVITSADQYQRLQVTISQLRSTQMELRARMEAQRSAENRLIQAAKLAAVGEMAAGIAHELNNPLTSVTGFAELVLEDMPEGSESRKDLETVMREALRARDVVRRLLDFARQSESIRARASLNEVVEDVVALSRHLIHMSGIELKIDLEKDLPWVLIDSNQMKQVLINLVHNALQAMPDGGEMEIKTSNSSRSNRDWVIVSVQDTGVGIPQLEQARIFEPFYTTKGNQGGTGLGLSVTYGIITDHGGQIDVVSQPGAGAKFTVWLPL
ncbi:MAG TPA: GAF domain-containing protein [Anaerolineales bacterium]|nr:GAF domain-containing protein [Anaerolineales bacterium]